MRTLTRLRVPAAFVLAIGLMSATIITTESCGGRPSGIVTPAGKSAYDADKVLVAVERLHDAVMEGWRQKHIPTATASAVVFWADQINEFADASQQGWEAAVRQAWRQAKCEVAELRDGGRYQVYAAVVNELLGVTAPEVCQ